MTRFNLSQSGVPFPICRMFWSTEIVNSANKPQGCIPAIYAAASPGTRHPPSIAPTNLFPSPQPTYFLFFSTNTYFLCNQYLFPFFFNQYLFPFQPIPISFSTNLFPFQPIPISFSTNTYFLFNQYLFPSIDQPIPISFSTQYLFTFQPIPISVQRYPADQQYLFPQPLKLILLKFKFAAIRLSAFYSQFHSAS